MACLPSVQTPSPASQAKQLPRRQILQTTVYVLAGFGAAQLRRGLYSFSGPVSATFLVFWALVMVAYVNPELNQDAALDSYLFLCFRSHLAVYPFVWMLGLLGVIWASWSPQMPHFIVLIVLGNGLLLESFSTPQLT